MQRRSRKPANQKPVKKTQGLVLSARAMGIYILGARGSGKSRLSGRVIAWQDYRAEIPLVIIDPLGGTIDNFLDKLFRFLQYVHPSRHSKYWSRVRYVDMSGKSNEGEITPWPLYYKLGTERSLREVAERYLQVILKSNPGLLNAQIQGWPPLHKIGVYTGMALAGLNLQITSAEHLLRHPDQYLSRLILAQDQYPELAPVIAFFRDEYMPMREADRARLTTPFTDKIFHFTLDPHLKAMFGSNTPGIDWREVERERQTVLIDFRHEQDPEMRRFKLLWVFSSLYEHIKLRGRNPRPLAVLVDEISALTNKIMSGENPLAAELDEFINQYMRGHNVWLTCIHQELHQIDEHMRDTLLSLGTYIIGGTSGMDAARLLADALFLRDPFRVKHRRKVWMSGGSLRGVPLAPYVVDTEPEFMPLEEQRELFAQRVKRLGLFQFLVRPALSEGSIGSAVTPISIHTVDWDPKTGQAAFPEQQVLARIRAILAARSGKPITALLAEQEQRGHILPPGQPSQPEQPDNHPAETQHTEPNQQQRGRTRRHRERLP
jgi:hypothetical protein